VLADIETDKATMEMEAFDDGVLTEIYVEAGGKAPVGSKIALILAEGETVEEEKDEESKDKKSESKTSEESPAAKAEKTSTSVSSERIKASPLAKKIAA